MVYFEVTAAAFLAAAAAIPAYALPFHLDRSLSTRDVEELNSLHARMSEVSAELKARDLYGELNQNDARDIEDFVERRSLPDYDDEFVARDFEDNLNLEAREYDKLLERYFDDLIERSDSSSDDSHYDDHEGHHHRHHHHHHHHDEDSASADSHHKKHFKKRGFFDNVGAWFRKVFHAETDDDKAYEKDLKEYKAAKEQAKQTKKAAKKAAKEAKKAQKAAKKAHKHAEKVEKKVEHDKSVLPPADSQQQRLSSSSESSYEGSGSQGSGSQPKGYESSASQASQSSPASSYGSADYHSSGSQSSPYTGAADSSLPPTSGDHGAESYPPSSVSSSSVSPSSAEAPNSYPSTPNGGYQTREFEDLEERDEFDLEERDDFELEERDDFDDLD
jgi:hypothetical protein